MENKLTNVLRHIKRVEDNCNLIAKDYEDSDLKFALQLIQRGRRHDVSKLNLTEFIELLDPSHPNFHQRLLHHRKHNDHHPEYWDGGIKKMNANPAAVAEMVCDWKARSEEFGSDLESWINDTFTIYNYTTNDAVYELILKFKNILTRTRF
jgi:hypothetical protein